MEPHPGSLRAVLRARLLDNMIRKVGTSSQDWKVLVVDRPALRILAAVIRINSLVDEGVTIVEMIDMRREPLPRIPAIYFLTPAPETIHHFVEESPAQYKAFHLFFTTCLPQFQMDLIRQNSQLRRKVKSLVELNIQFLPLETRLFSLDRPAASLPQLHAQDSKEARQEMSITSERLAEACNLLAPGIEWTVRADASSTATRTVASLVKEQLETFRSQKPNSQSNSQPNHQPNSLSDNSATSAHASLNVPTKATLLVVDRLSDMISPLVHEFSYQSMAHDLLDLDYRKPGGAHIALPEEDDPEKKKVLQIDDEEKDATWCSIRSCFIEQAISEAQTQFKKFLETDAAFKIRGKEAGKVDIKEMGAAVRSLPESQMRADMHAMHIKATKECLSVCTQMGLTKLALVEQNLVAGELPNGIKIRSEAMVESIVETLSDETIPVEHRLRLLLISLIICEGLSGLSGEHSKLAVSPTFRPKFRRSPAEKLMDLSSAHSCAIKGLNRILQVAKSGFDPYGGRNERGEGEESVTSILKKKYATRQAEKQSKKTNAAKHRRHGLRDEDERPFDVARYHPPLRSVLMDLVDDRLDEQAFMQIGTVSVESIIQSVGHTKVQEEHSDSEAEEGNRKRRAGRLGSGHKFSGLNKSFGKGNSSYSKESEEDDGRFRMAEQDHLYVVFVVGGVCYSEVRGMLEVCAKREANILLGGSQVLIPQTFVQMLGAIADPVMRIQVMLPPLPIELAQSRAAARALASEAEACDSQDVRHGGSGPGEQVIEGGNDKSQNGVDEEDIRHGDVDVVVVEYRKKRGLGLFGRKKR